MLSQIISLGDVIERCVVSGISKHISYLTQNIANLSFEFSSCLFAFFAQLINDKNFYKLLSIAMFKQIPVICPFFEKALQNNSSLKSFQPFSDFIFHIFDINGLNACFEKGVDIGRILAKFLSDFHSIVISYFDSSQSEDRDQLFSYLSFTCLFEFCDKMSHPEIVQIFFEEFIHNEAENEGKCARNSLQLIVDDPSLKSFIWVNDFCISESLRSNIPKLNLIPISSSLLKMVQNINIKNEASFFDGYNISFQLFVHSTLSILLIQHDKKYENYS
jgi:hypothetical protein